MVGADDSLERQEHNLLIHIAPGDAGTVHAPEPITQGRTGRYAGLLDNYATGEEKGVPIVMGRRCGGNRAREPRRRKRR